MIYRKKFYKINPEKLDAFNNFFHTYLYPNQIKHGSKLIGRWVNELQDEITTLWEYKSMEQYEAIEHKIRNSDLHREAQVRRKELGNLYIESHQEFLTSTAPLPASYHPPKHIVSVSGYIANENGEVLLVRNLHRSDTMEMPGGQVED
ncbi:NIPSNAP family protein [Virgibacillus tibetensis]